MIGQAETRNGLTSLFARIPIRTVLHNDRLWFLASLSAVLSGIFLRVLAYRQNRALWLDTSDLAVALMGASYGDLTHILPNAQAAPLGFLLATKFLGEQFNYAEQALVLIPFLSSVVSVPLFWALCRQISDRPVEIFFMVIPFCFSSTLIYYATEFKQYSSDLALAILIAHATQLAWKQRLGKGSVIWLAGLGMVGVLCSHTAIFVCAAMGTWLTILVAKTRGRSLVQALAMLLAVWAISILTNYLLILTRNVSPVYFKIHQSAFAPFPFTPEALRWYGFLLKGMTQFPLGFMGGYQIPILGLGLGVWLLFREKRTTVAFFSLPLLVMFSASILRKYPLYAGDYEVYSRFLVFAVPFLLIPIGKGLGYLVMRGPRLVTFALLFYLALSPGIQRALKMKFLDSSGGLRTLSLYYESHRQPGDKIYVGRYAISSFQYYTRGREVPFIAGKAQRTDIETFKAEVQSLKDSGRVWFLLSHLFDKEAAHIAELDKVATRLDYKPLPAGLLVYYDFSKTGGQ